MDASLPNFSQDGVGLGGMPQVWQFSDFNKYNQIRFAYPAFLSIPQKARLERIRQARLLDDGKHWRLFLFEGRTQFNFPEMNVNGKIERPFLRYNLLKLIAQKSADLLFGEEPAIRIDDDLQQKEVAAMVKRCHLHDLFYRTSKQCAVDGEAYFETIVQSTVDDPTGAVYVQRVNAADLFPEGKLQPNGQYRSYVRYNARNANGGEPNKTPDWKLLITRYVDGAILRQVRQLDQNGVIAPKQLDLNQWPQESEDELPIEPETKTGLNRPSIVYVPNMLSAEDTPVSEFDGLVEHQDSLNAKQTQIARVLAMHSDPKLAMSLRNAGTNPAGEGDVISSYGVHYFDNPDEIPQYITWRAELEFALKDRDETRDALLIEAEMSPILLGIQTGATSKANAFKSIRLEAINSLTKAQRRAVSWRAAIDRVLALAQDMQMRVPGSSQYQRQPLSVEMRDGLPVDTDSKMAEIVGYHAERIMSDERAVELQIADPDRRARELRALAAQKKAEAAAATPSILMQPPGNDGAQTAGADDAAAADEAKNLEVAA